MSLFALLSALAYISNCNVLAQATSFAAGFFQQFLDYRHQYQHRNDHIAAAHIKPSPPRFRGHQSPHHHLNLNLEHFGAFWWILPPLSPNLVVSTMFSNEFRIIFTSLASRPPSFLTIVGPPQSGSAQHKNTQNVHTCIYVQYANTHTNTQKHAHTHFLTIVGLK